MNVDAACTVGALDNCSQKLPNSERAIRKPTAFQPPDLVASPAIQIVFRPFALVTFILASK
ncbi:MAG: hypothetical protein ABIP61_03890 [Burkholderiaceae bacterium]